MLMKMNKNTQSDFAKDILQKIKKENVVITPKWHFALREYVLWLLILLSISVGAVSVSVIILHLLQIEIAIAVEASGGMMHYIAVWAPYLWLFLLSLFIITTWYNFKHTKKGYRYSYILVVLGSIFASFVIGAGLYFGGAAEHAERYAEQVSNGYYIGSQERRVRIWSQPEKGLLSGIPLDVADEKLESFVLIDASGKLWHIESEDITDSEWASINVAPKVGIIGMQKSADIFIACRIVPWAEPGERNEMRRQIEAMLPEGIKVNERNIFELRNSICEE